jgi:hypothetical protein
MLEPSAALPLVVPRGDGAAGITGARPRVQMRYLGPAFPAATGPELSAQQVTGQVVPAMVNPQLTVNSSISSAPTPVVTSGTGDGSGNIVIAGGTFATTGTPTVTTAASVTPNVGTSSSITNSAAVAAPVINSNAAIVTPTAAASALSVGQFAAGPGATTGAATATGTTLVTPGAIINNNNSGTLTPTLSSGATPTPTAAASLGVRTISGATVSTTNGLTTTTTPNASTSTSSVRTASATGRLASPVNRSGASSGSVRVTTGANGNVVITNQ